MLSVVALSLYVSGAATALAALVGIPLGAAIGLREFGGRALVKTVVYTLYGFPPVLAGLLVYVVLSRTGPLGALGWLFTPTGMILAQLLIVLPLVTGVTISAVAGVGRDVKDTARTLGAGNWALAKTVLAEARVGVVTAVMVGFGRAVSEVGAVLIVGGNIRGHTRVLTTAIVLETATGDFVTASLLGLVLFSIAFAIFFLFHRFQEAGYL